MQLTRRQDCPCSSHGPQGQSQRARQHESTAANGSCSFTSITCIAGLFYVAFRSQQTVNQLSVAEAALCFSIQHCALCLLLIAKQICALPTSSLLLAACKCVSLPSVLYCSARRGIWRTGSSSTSSSDHQCECGGQASHDSSHGER